MADPYATYSKYLRYKGGLGNYCDISPVCGLVDINCYCGSMSLITYLSPSSQTTGSPDSGLAVSVTVSVLDEALSQG